MKKNIFKSAVTVTAAVMCSALIMTFAGCSKKTGASPSASGASNEGKIKVVATIFPLYDWAKNLTSGTENVSLELLVKNGVDLHSFQPSASDMVKISGCDVLIYVGGESDAWVKDALKNSINKNMIAINLMELLSENVKAEELVEGMQNESDQPADSSAEACDPEYDEHIWLSLVNAKLSCQQIAAVISALDESEGSKIAANYAAYTKQIDGVWASCVTRDRKMIVVCDRFPFRYMADELGVIYFAAFPGCSAETEASFETVAFLSNKIKDLQLNKIFVTESSDKKLARTVIKNSGLQEKDCQILVLDSMQSTTLEQADKGKNYIDTMKKNFSLIAEANR